MGGDRIDEDWELTTSTNAVSTMVLVGKTGNGKSATGNTILGRKAFRSLRSFSGVTNTCEVQSTILKDGRTVNVIDTPGMFDLSAKSEFVGKEIVNCVNLAKDGIHAVLLVCSVRSRFSEEEWAAVKTLQSFFGEGIVKYMIVVFTGGDDFEDSDDFTFNDHIFSTCPDALQNILNLCNNRVILFDNKTKDENKQAEQVNQLLFLVDSVVARNGGKPFSDQLFVELKEGASKLQFREKQVESMKGFSQEQISEFKKEIYKSYDDQLARITKMVEEKLTETIQKLEKQLAEEQAARLEAEKSAQDEIRELRENLERAKRAHEEIQKRSQMCAIL